MITTATYITFLRIGLIVPLMCCIMWHYMGVAAAILVLAAATDFLDGYIARTYNQQSDLGAFLDPLADKLLMITIFGAMWYYSYDVPTWFIIIFCIKECLLGIGSLFFFLRMRKIVHARLSGKIAMILYLIYSLILLTSRYTYVYTSCIAQIVTLVTLYALYDYAHAVYSYIYP